MVGPGPGPDGMGMDSHRERQNMKEAAQSEPSSLDRLAAELLACDSVIDVETAETTRVVKFKVRVGRYNHLRSDVVSVLGRWDFDVYSMPPKYDHNYWAIEP